MALADNCCGVITNTGGEAKNVQFWRKFWGLVFEGRWKVVVQQNGKIVGSHWSRRAAQDQSSELNDLNQYIGSPYNYVVRWM